MSRQQNIRTMCVSVLVMTMLVIPACWAQAPSINIRPTAEAQCTAVAGLEWVASLSSNYTTASQVPKALCIFSAYEEACPTLSGVIACDKTVNKCKQWESSNTWKAADINKLWASTTTAPSVCLRHGTHSFFPDAAVLVVVQPVISSLVFIGVAIASFINFRNKVHMGSILIVISMCIIGIIQTVSYHYLNAYIVIAAGLIALATYCQKRPTAVGVGMFVLLSAFFWVTFSSGLGNIQHHSRILAGPAVDDSYELMCNTYYAGFFTYPRVLMSDSHNIQEQYHAYCHRPFLAAQLFMMIIQEYLLILLMAMGIYAITEPRQSESRSLKPELTEEF